MEHLNDQLRRDFPGAKLQHRDLVMTTMSKEIERVMDEIKTTAAKQPTLMEQLIKVQSINTALRERIASEKLRLLQEHDRRWVDVQQLYDRRIRECTRDLETERKVELGLIDDEYQKAKLEIDEVLRRMGD